MELLTDEEGLMAIRSARGAVEYVCANKPKPALNLTSIFREKRGVFVTLTKNGQLRGCIGLPYPMM
ncbi:AMMECR1 domain-containing protein, partial [Methanoregula sp.]|uniref:AMMECR1 domain-containing protein n=1 Tax=Methanoregula sp. TaxID=2052170 RepID=UPI000CBC8094